jgi:hypothetical protein
MPSRKLAKESPEWLRPWFQLRRVHWSLKVNSRMLPLFWVM